MTENELDAASAQPEEVGSGDAGAEGGPGSREPGKPIAAAYFSVVTMVGALGGVSAFVGPFAKSGPGLILLTVSLVVILVVIDLVAKEVAKKLQQEITASARALAIVVVLALALGAGGGYLIGHRHSPSSTTVPVTMLNTAAAPTQNPAIPAATSASASASAPAEACTKPLTITSPTKDAQIVGHTGVNIGITACGLTADETGWLFDYDVSSQTYGLDGDGGPIVKVNQNITFDDTPVGQAGDQDELVELTLVLANSTCSAALNAMNLSTNQPTTLPASCQIESQVEVSETW